MNTDKKLSYFLGAGLILAPLFIRAETHIDLRYFKDWFFIIFTALIVFVWGVKPNKKLWIIPVIALYSFFRVQASANFPIFYQFTLLLSGLILIYSLSTKNIDTNIVLNSLVAVSLISSIWLILEYYNIDVQMYLYKSIGLEKAARMAIVNGQIVPLEQLKANGPLGQHTISGALISCCLPAYFRRKYFLLIPLIVWGIIISNSAMSIISALFSVLFIAILVYRRAVTLLIPLAALLCYLYNQFPIHFSDNGRINAWKDILVSYGFRFWGNGPGWFNATSNIKNQAGHVFKHAHSELIDLYIALGVPGILMAVYLLTKIRITNKNIFAIFAALLINSFGNLTYHISALSLISIITYSILTRNTHDKEENC